MAHFAKLDINGKVIAVHVVDDSDTTTGDGIEDEKVGQAFLDKPLIILQQEHILPEIILKHSEETTQDWE